MEIEIVSIPERGIPQRLKSLSTSASLSQALFTLSCQKVKSGGGGGGGGWGRGRVLVSVGDSDTMEGRLIALKTQKATKGDQTSPQYKRFLFFFSS